MHGKVGRRFITCLKQTAFKFRITANWRSSQMADSTELHVRTGSHCKRFFQTTAETNLAASSEINKSRTPKGSFRWNICSQDLHCLRYLDLIVTETMKN